MVIAWFEAENIILKGPHHLTNKDSYIKKNKCRSSHRRCSVKKAVLKNFTIFTGKHQCWSPFLKKLQPLRPGTLLKRDSNTGVFL